MEALSQILAGIPDLSNEELVELCRQGMQHLLHRMYDHRRNAMLIEKGMQTPTPQPSPPAKPVKTKMSTLDAVATTLLNVGATGLSRSALGEGVASLFGTTPNEAFDTKVYQEGVLPLYRQRRVVKLPNGNYALAQFHH